MHRDKDVCPGEDGDTNRLDNAPGNMFSLTSAARARLKRIDASPTRATEIIQNGSKPSHPDLASRAEDDLSLKCGHPQVPPRRSMRPAPR